MNRLYMPHGYFGKSILEWISNQQMSYRIVDYRMVSFEKDSDAVKFKRYFDL